MKKLLNVISSILLLAILICSAALFVGRLQGKSISLFGFRLMRVITDSMEPEIKVGTVILIKETPAEELKIGDTVTYKCETGLLAGQYITHKITDIKNEAGNLTIQTMGVKQGATPDTPIRPDQIAGRYTASLGILSLLYRLFISRFGLIIVVLPMIFLMVTEIKNLISAAGKENEDAGSKEN